MDDISCTWQIRAMVMKEYLFQWGINLYTYTTDGTALRAKLAGIPKPTGRYTEPVKAGPRTTLKVARLQHSGNWTVNANYGALASLAARLKEKTSVALEVKDLAGPPFTEGGVLPAGLTDYDVAYIVGTTGFTFSADDKAALKAFTDKGGILWFEAAMGTLPFDQAVQQLARDMKWEVKLLGRDHPLMTGRMDPATGYDLTKGVEFRPGFRMQRLGRQYAEFFGLFAGDKMVGVYSPLDTVFASTPYEAFRCRGYKTEDAQAVAANLALYFSTLK